MQKEHVSSRKLVVIWVLLMALMSATQVSGQINTEKMRQDLQENDWTFSLSEKMTLKRGNTSFLSFTTDLRSAYRLDRYTTFLRLNYSTATAVKTRFENSGFLHWRNSWQLTRRTALEQYNQVEFDRSLDLDNRLLTGAGVRLELRPRLHFGCSAMVEREDYEGWRRVRGVGSLYLSYFATPRPGMSFSNVLYLQPVLTELSDWRLLNEGGFSFSLTSHLAFNFTINLRYDSSPSDPTGSREKADLSLENGIVLHW